MNKLLELKKSFHEAPGQRGGSQPRLKKNRSVRAEKVNQIIIEIENILNEWQGRDSLISNILLEITYTEIVAKSNRISAMFKHGSLTPNQEIVGARFKEDPPGRKRHVITYYVARKAIQETISNLQKVSSVIKESFNGEIFSAGLQEVTSQKKKIDLHGLSISKFGLLVVDLSYVAEIDSPESNLSASEAMLINLYDLHQGKQSRQDTQNLLAALGIPTREQDFLNATTLLLTKDKAQILFDKAPYLVAMKTKDFSNYYLEVQQKSTDIPSRLPKVGNEPTIGVIDTNCYGEDYFGDWVEIHNEVDEKLQERSKHGTEVSSLIVAGPMYNPDLDDGCGFFKVRHFGVMQSGKNSSFTIVKSIQKIIRENRDIKVWNLSLGSPYEIKENFISPEGAILDQLQNQYDDIIFVIAGTNLTKEQEKTGAFIGAPADSLNSLVVSSVTRTNKPADYDRHGPVLSFFEKPDVAYYGGDENSPILVFDSLMASWVQGTSFAAPWIARKMSYLMQVVGLSREQAKALLIDSAVKWNQPVNDPNHLLGHGVVPIKITDILNVPKDEIRFVVSGSASSYNTYSDGIPLPLTNGKFPYVARATLAYFPKCSRNQGVDYTNTELDLHFGRIKGNNIQSINNNRQANPTIENIPERAARKQQRKWDNIKIIQEAFTERTKPRANYQDGLWEIKLLSKERLNRSKKHPLKFALVITFKNINGDNLIEIFKQQCRMRGWIVNEIDLEERIKVNAEAQTEIEWDD